MRSPPASLAAVLGDARSGLNTAQRALAVTAHNVANVNTEGYVRKVLSQEARAVTDATVFNRIAVHSEPEIDPATGQPIDPKGGVELVSAGVRATLTPELEPTGPQAITTALREGRIKGLLEMRDGVLPRLNDQVQELAASRYRVIRRGPDRPSRPPAAGSPGRRRSRS